MPTIIPSLWFDGQAEQAARFYTSLFPNSEITAVSRSTEAGPGESGTVLTVEFTLAGQPFLAINGGAQFRFTEAISLMISCADQAEIDHYWDGLIADGGAPNQCGWLKDRYGLSWQVVPAGMAEIMNDPDPARAERAMAAMLGMVKIDIAALHAAAAGEAATA